MSVSPARYYKFSKFAKFVSKYYFSKHSPFLKQNILVLKELIQDYARDFRVSIHLLVLNLQSLNSQFLFVGREKRSKNPLRDQGPGVGFD